MISGPVCNPPLPKGVHLGFRPPLHLLDSYTAIVTTASLTVTGVAGGGF